ncbi:uncharacterized protein [Antedon mediterranea]|uniref:uncharacterized protein n=1 Tax=Antedon mediterranea TaxID=105859 RepID=UPI003AF6F665
MCGTNMFWRKWTISKTINSISLVYLIGLCIESSRCQFGTVSDSCPEGWFLFEGSCYSVEKRANWTRARDKCLEIDAYLVVVGNQNENDFLVTLKYSDAKMWIGLSDMKNETDYIWVTNESSQYRNFDSGEPSNSRNENCVWIKPGESGKWNDVSCDVEASFVCERGCHESKCQEEEVTQPTDNICTTDPCENGGICFELSDTQTVTNNFYCACPPGFRGPTCTGVIVGCGRNEFACKSGECISLSKMCDNVPYDCADNSDEPDECQKRECKDLSQLLDTMTARCADVKEHNVFTFEGSDSPHIFRFNVRRYYFPEGLNTIGKIEVNISSSVGNKIREDGTLFVALLPSEPNVFEIPVIHFRVYLEHDKKETVFEKLLSDIHSFDRDGVQDIWFSFLPDGGTKHILLPPLSLTLTTRSFIADCNDIERTCLDRYAEWAQVSEELKEYDCGVTSINTAVEPLYKQCIGMYR